MKFHLYEIRFNFIFISFRDIILPCWNKKAKSRPGMETVVSKLNSLYHGAAGDQEYYGYDIKVGRFSYFSYFYYLIIEFTVFRISNYQINWKIIQ